MVGASDILHLYWAPVRPLPILSPSLLSHLCSLKLWKYKARPAALQFHPIHVAVSFKGAILGYPALLSGHRWALGVVSLIKKEQILFANQIHKKKTGWFVITVAQKQQKQYCHWMPFAVRNSWKVKSYCFILKSNQFLEMNQRQSDTSYERINILTTDRCIFEGFGHSSHFFRRQHQWQRWRWVLSQLIGNPTGQTRSWFNKDENRLMVKQNQKR